MNLFKFAVVPLYMIFCFTPLLFAQTAVTNETDFINEMNQPSPNLLVNDSIYFIQSFQDTLNKNVTVGLSSGVIINGSSIPSGGQGFNFSGSTVAFSFGNSNVISGFNKAFSLANGTTLNLNGSGITFSQNISENTGGGAFYLSGGSDVSLTAADRVLFSLNKSTGSGGALYLAESSLFEVDASTVLFRNNSSSENGGAVYAIDGSTVNLSGAFAEFVGNKSGFSGGAVYGSTGTYFSFSSDTLLFENNTAQVSGGGIYGVNAEFEFNGTESSFDNNNALFDGGALYAQSGSVFTFNASSNTFFHNESGRHGGAIYADSNSEIIFNGDHTRFDVNKSSMSGGAVYAAGGAEMTFSSLDTHFQYNSAENGGAVYGNNASFVFNGNEVYFTGNSASSFGGALYAVNGSSFSLNSSTVSFRYNNASSGGALYIEDGSITADNAEFLYNKAFSGYGGAVYMNGVSSANSANLSINALTGDVLFSGNEDSTGANDIYMHQYGNIEFNAGTGRKITLEGGISARADFGNSIIKTGAGVLEIAGDSLDYKGDIRVSAGTLSIINNADFSADKFIVDTGAAYSTVSNLAGQVTRVGNAQINGEMNIEIDLATYNSDRMIADSSISSTADGKVNLNSTDSTLNVTSFGTLGLGTTRITIIEAEGGVTGTFSNDPFASYIFPPNTSYLFEYLADRVNLYVSRLSSFYTISKMTHNQKEVALSFDEISKANTSAGMSALMTTVDSLANDSLKKAAFDALSGSFIANAITAGALRNGMYELYERVQPRFCPHEAKISESLWGQVYLSNNRYDKDENTLDDFDMTGYGIQAGYDLFTGENSLGGFYISYGYNSLEQGADEADMQDYGLGFYGGWFGNLIDIKGSISGGVQSFDLKRNIKFAGLKTNADFNTYSFRADGQVEFKIGLGDSSLELRPFIGLQGGYVINEEITEKGGGAANLEIDSGDYLRITGLAGAGIGSSLEKFSWYGKVYAGYLMTGTQSEIDGKFSDNGNEMNIWGTELGSFGGGAGIGAEYKLNRQWSLYANANAGFADGASGYYGNIGINYSFCRDTVTDNKKEDKEKPVKSAAGETKGQVSVEEEQPASKEQIVFVEEAASVSETGKVKETVEPETDSRQEDAAEKTEPYTEEAPVYEEKKTEEIKTAPATYVSEPAAERKTYYPHDPKFRGTASFVVDDYGINNEEKERIKQQAEEIKKKGYKKIVVSGHTDSTGDEALNNTLSLQRAKAVYEELIANGIDPERIEYVGYGDRKPVATNVTAEGRELNRRTDIAVDEPAIVPGVIYTASYFIVDGHNLPSEVKDKIKEQSDEIKMTDYNNITIEGHADSTGNDLINNPLSERRAKAVYDEFIRRGIPAGKMSYTGYGSKRPIDTNSTKKGRANNRRVDIVVK